jgi:hypothetical protein
MIDFYNACPFVFEGEFIDTRKREVVLWRSVGMVWKWLGGCSLAESAKEFHRDHAVTVHAIKAVINAYEGYGHREIIENIEKVKSSFPLNYYADDDIWVNYAKNLVRLDGLVGKML